MASHKNRGPNYAREKLPPLPREIRELVAAYRRLPRHAPRVTEPQITSARLQKLSALHEAEGWLPWDGWDVCERAILEELADSQKQ